MWVPEWLYQRLPILYIAASGMYLWVLGVSFATVPSALLLLCAALLTRRRRYSARRGT
jgi:hypothetical protein